MPVSRRRNALLPKTATSQALGLFRRAGRTYSYKRSVVPESPSLHDCAENCLHTSIEAGVSIYP